MTIAMSQDISGGNGSIKLSQYRLSSLFVATGVVSSILTAFVACKNTYEVHGAVGSSFGPILVGFFVFVTLPFLLFRRIRRFVCVLIIGACLAYSIRQAVLKNRLSDLKIEVARIVEFLEEYGAENGRYPEDLSGYTFQKPKLKTFIIYNNPRYAPYSIVFHPYRYTGTGHWYYPRHGFYRYYYEDD